MRFASALTQFVDLERALGDAVGRLRERLDGADPSLLCAFASPHHEEGWRTLAERLRREFPAAVVFGCSAQSVIGAGREAEDGPGLALVGASLPGVHLHPFHARGGELPDLPLPEDAHVLLLADPFDERVEGLMERLDARFPGGTKIGGIASGARQPGRNWLLLGDGSARSGVVGLVLHGHLRLDAVVAQGCRPVGEPLFATCEGHVITALDGRRPMDVLQDLYDAAPAPDQELFQTSLFLGLAMQPSRDAYDAGDFLVRNLIGADPDTGVLHVAAEPGPRRVVQFHLRDAASAASDVRQQLASYAARSDEAPAGALLFSCLGRGQGLYGAPDHDSMVLFQELGRVPLGGFFGNGEIGPVQGRTFLHGYTSAFGLFRPGA